MKSKTELLTLIILIINIFLGTSIPVSYAKINNSYSITDDSLKTKQEKKEKTFIKFWYGHNCYKMQSFNEKLRLEGNNEINDGHILGFEFTNHKLCIKIPMFKEELILKLPVVGLEYLSANSVTTHTFSNEGSNISSVTVKWVLPVFGIYIAPEFNVLNKAIQFKTNWFRILPIRFLI